MCFQRYSKRRKGESRPSGRSFHNRGTAAAKLLSPRLLCVRGTTSFCMSLQLDRSGRRPASERSWQSSARYAGAAPTSDWCTSPTTLKTTRWRTRWLWWWWDGGSCFTSWMPFLSPNQQCWSSERNSARSNHPLVPSLSISARWFLKKKHYIIGFPVPVPL